MVHDTSLFVMLIVLKAHILIIIKKLKGTIYKILIRVVDMVYEDLKKKGVV